MTEATRVTDWALVKELALATVGKKAIAGKEITRAWKLRILMARHSPIRALQFVVRMQIPYWVSVHLVRHKIGVEHFVTTQRDDRTGSDVPRAEKPQGTMVEHVELINAQALIEISERRHCFEASKETTQAWDHVRREIKKLEPEVAELMVPSCIRTGCCTMFNDCGYWKRPRAIRERERFLNIIKEMRQ